MQASGTDKVRHRATSHTRPTVKDSSVSAARALNCSQSLNQSLRSLTKVSLSNGTPILQL